jgi:hypothetical protein
MRWTRSLGRDFRSGDHSTPLMPSARNNGRLSLSSSIRQRLGFPQLGLRLAWWKRTFRISMLRCYVIKPWRWRNILHKSKPLISFYRRWKRLSAPHIGRFSSLPTFSHRRAGSISWLWIPVSLMDLRTREQHFFPKYNGTIKIYLLKVDIYSNSWMTTSQKDT